MDQVTVAFLVLVGPFALSFVGPLLRGDSNERLLHELHS